MSHILTDEFQYRCIATYDNDSEIDAPPMAVFMDGYDDIYLSKDIVETLLMPDSVDRGGGFNQELLMAWEAFDSLA